MPQSAENEKTQDGLTLIELIVTIAVVGIASAIAVPLVADVTSKVAVNALKAELESVGAFLEESISYTGGVTTTTVPDTLEEDTQYAFSDLHSVTPSRDLRTAMTGSGTRVSPYVASCVTGYTHEENWQYNAAGLAPGTCGLTPIGALPPSISYSASSWNAGANNPVLVPAVTGTGANRMFSYTGTLPAGVTFDATTGIFTGPDSASWQMAPLRAGGANNDSGTDIAATADGGYLVTGTFAGTATFGSTTLTSAGGHDTFVAKLSATGQWLWASSVRGTGFELDAKIGVLPDGGALVFGKTTTTTSLTFGSLNMPVSSGLWIAKISADGTWLWAQKAGGNANDSAAALAVSADGTAVITASVFSPTAQFGTFTVTGGTNYTKVVAKISADGTWAWMAQATGGNTGPLGAPRTLTPLADGSFFIAGRHTVGTMTFGSTTLTTPRTGYTAVVSGNGVWQSAEGLAIDPESASVLPNGGIVLAGVFSGTQTLGTHTIVSAGSNDIVVAKRSASGVWEWATRLGNATADTAVDVKVLANGTIAVSGYTLGSLPGAFPLTHTNYQGFIATFNSSGTMTGAVKAVDGYVAGNILVLSNDSIVITGKMSAGTNTYGDTTLTSAGGEDVYVAKLSSNLVFNSAQTGFPASLTVTVTDKAGSSSTDVVLSVN